MRHIFIINPVAGKTDSSKKLHHEILSACQKHNIDPIIFISEHPGYEQTMAKKMCSFFSNEDIRFYSCGGSGTLTRILSGIDSFEHVEVACCPCGLTNDFLKSFGSDAASFSSIEKLITGQPAALDIIDLAGTLVPNFVCFGTGNHYFSDTMIMNLAGMIHPNVSYVLGTLTDIIKGGRDQYEITIDGKDYFGEYCFVGCYNGRCMGGNLTPLYEARPNDGMLNFLLLDHVSRSHQLKFFKRIMKSNLDRNDPHVHIVKGKTLTVTRKNNKELLSFNCDGECVIPANQTTTIRLRPDRLRFVVPKGAKILPPELGEY